MDMSGAFRCIKCEPFPLNFRNAKLLHVRSEMLKNQQDFYQMSKVATERDVNLITTEMIATQVQTL